MINISDGSLYTLANPINPPPVGQTQRLIFMVLNNTAGAINLQWGTAYQFPTAWVQPLAGKRKKVAFDWNQLTAKWVADAWSPDY
jgi:hypothetical protein